MARTRQKGKTSWLAGQMLVAMPSMTDKRFQRSVIYLCSHSSKGAMGLIVNQRANKVAFGDLLRELKLRDPSDPRVSDANGTIVHIGGPVSTERGFVLHSDDYFAADATLTVADGLCLTATLDVLKAMSAGKGPRRALLALGYSGWAAGQLESEMAANGWLHCPADAELVFGADLDGKYNRALGKIGIDPSHLVSEAGHA